MIKEKFIVKLRIKRLFMEFISMRFMTSYLECMHKVNKDAAEKLQI